MNKNFLVAGIILFLLLTACNVSAIDWSQFRVFDGSTTPYAANGPGCRTPELSGLQQAMTPGQNCPNESNPVFDLGAVWVDRSNGYIAWKIMAPNLSDTGFCGGPFSNNAWQFAIQFDIDNNISTGCRMGEPCYPGADFRLWLWGDGQIDFEIYNYSRRDNGGIPQPCVIGQPGMCYSVMNQGSFDPMYNVSFNYTCGSPSTLLIAINESAINVTAMQFAAEVSVFGPPVEMLGGFSGGEFMDKIMFAGGKDMMFEDQHPCMSYDNSDETSCTTNSDNITGAENCIWDSFMEKCKPDFGSMNCSDFCGACESTGECQAGAKGKCMVMAAPPMLPPEAKSWDDGGTKICVEDMSKFMFGSQGSCDENCKYCYSNETCSSSAYPDPMGGNGCKWVTDPFFGKSWCDLSTVQISGSNSVFTCGANKLDRCFNSTACDGIGGNWSVQFKVCYNASNELCFDGTDNNADGKIDCADTQCLNNPACGGDIDVLTGGYGTLNPFEAMKKMLFSDMDPSPPVMLFSEPAGDPLPMHIDAREFMIKDMGNALGMGVKVEGFVNMSSPPPFPGISLLCGGTGSGAYYYFVDTDANESTGCDANISESVKAGFEYKFDYEIQNNGTDGPLEIRRGYRCMPDGNFSLYPARMTGPPDMDMFGGEPQKISCVENVAIIAVDKTDLGNPSGNMRFIAATGTNDTPAENANDTLLGPDNNGIYYTPGAVDFKPNDCFANPMACGSAFGIIGGGKFMPFEDCFIGSGDEDLDGLSNCEDSDCQMAPWCAGQYNISADKTAPTVVGNRVETFNDFAFLHWTTNEPTNATVTFHTNCMNSTAINTFYELGGPMSFDDYKPWHDIGIKNGDTDSKSQAISIASSTTYFYKLSNCDKAGNCGTSACLNFTTRSSAQPVNFKFDFIPPANPMLNTTMIKIWNGTEYENITQGSTQTKNNYLENAKLKFDNPEANWEIELKGIDMSKALDFNISTAFNISNESGRAHIGMQNQKWLDLAQNLGVDSITIKIPGSGNKLIKCNENNITDCSDVSEQATLNESGPDYIKWEIPISLGFSTYTLGEEVYNLSFTNLSVASGTTNISLVMSYTLNITNNDNVSRIYNLSVISSGSATGTINGSAILQLSFENNTAENSHVVVVNITDAIAESVSFVVKATLVNNSAVNVNSSEDLTLTAIFIDNTVPVIAAISPGINVTVSTGANLHYYNVTDTGSSSINCTMYWNNGSNWNYNLPITPTNGSTYGGINVTSGDGLVSWFVNCTDNGGNIATSGVRLYYVDAVAPTISISGPADAVTTSNASIAFNMTPSDSIDTNISCGLYINGSLNMTLYLANSTSIAPILNFTNGTKTWYWNCTDNANNPTTSTERSFTVDTVYPALTVSSPTATTYNGSYAGLNYTASDGSAITCKYSLDGAANVTLASCINTSLHLANGSHTLAVFVIDAAGLMNYSSVTFNISDTVAPGISGALPSGSQLSSTTAVTLSVTTDENATCRYSTSDLAYVNMTGNFTDNITSHTATYSVSAGNSYAIYARCSDMSGNANNASTAISFSVAAATSSSSGGGGGGGSSSASNNTNPQSTKSWNTIAANTMQIMNISNTRLGLADIKFSLNKAANVVKLTTELLPVKPLEANTPEGSVYKYLKITKAGFVDDDVVMPIKISFRVEKSWFTANGISSADVVLKRYSSNRWMDLTTTKVSEDSSYVYYEAESPGFSYFLIGTKAVPKPTTLTNPVINISAGNTAPDESTVTPEETVKPGEENKTGEPAKEKKINGALIGKIAAGIIVVALAAVFIVLALKRKKKSSLSYDEASEHHTEHHK
ncbi:MAG: PGF-pre-PGF domain-containing protein [archaeon]